jgi:hypothetical protein
VAGRTQPQQIAQIISATIRDLFDVVKIKGEDVPASGHRAAITRLG